MKRYTMILASLCYCVMASAATAQWKVVGEGELHVMFWHAYDSKLFTHGEPYDPAKPFALENTYRMDFSQSELMDRTFTEMRRHGKFTPEDQERWSKQLKQLWPDIKENDTIRAEVLPKEQVKFAVNGKPTGAINDALFAELFPQIWLGEKTSEPALRKKLLSLNKN